MPKNIRDVIPTGRKSIRSISVPIRKTESISEEVPASDNLVPLRPKRGNTFSLSKRSIWLSAIALVVIITISVMALFDGATLTYKRKVSNLTFAADTYTAYKTPSAGDLAFSIIKVSSDRTASVPATGEETVNEKATGVVVIYNEQATAQTLVKTTRLETQDGKIYRIPSNISVPAKGSLEVKVEADKVGEAYNIGLSDFTLPGLKGTPRFEQVYARSKSAMAGGFAGTRKKVSDADLAKAKASIEGSLNVDLMSKASAEIPAGYVLFPDLSTISYSQLPQGGGGTNTVVVGEHADMSAAIFKAEDISQYLALAKLGTNNVPSQVLINDFSKMKATLVANTSADLSKATSIRFSLTGSAGARFITDEASLASDLIGVDKSNLDSVLKKYPSIISASAVIRPFWKSLFPSDASKIKIEVQE